MRTTTTHDAGRGIDPRQLHNHLCPIHGHVPIRMGVPKVLDFFVQRSVGSESVSSPSSRSRRLLT